MVFQKLRRNVIETGLCTHCGTCAGLSENTLIMQETEWGPLPYASNKKSVKLPEWILQTCPGMGINYPELNTSIFKKLPTNWLIGHYNHFYIGHSNESSVRRQGASGGVISHVLIYLLEKGLIQGAVCVRQGLPKPWQAKPVIATSRNEILECSQSVYIPVPVNTLLPEINQFQGDLAYVGLPDQILSIRKMQQMDYSPAKKIKYFIGPYVGTLMYFQAIISFLQANHVYNIKEVSRLRYREGEWPGYLQIETQSGKIYKAEKFYYNYLIPFFITRSTLVSVDFTNELTDISVGDAWNPELENQREGFSVVISRSEKGDHVLSQMARESLLTLHERSLKETVSMHGHMLDFKKRGAFIRMAWMKKTGRYTPDFGYRPTNIHFTRILVEYVISGLFILCGTQMGRKIVRWIPLQLLGPLFNMLRKHWRSISKPTKRKGLGDYHVETW